MAKFSPTKSDSVFTSSANKCAATQSSWSRNARFSASFLPKKWLDIKRHRYDDIIMGFYGKAFNNGLQAKTAGSKPILFPANQNVGRSGLYHSEGRLSMCSPPFDRSPSRCSHRWFEPIFSIFHHLPFRLPANLFLVCFSFLS